MKNKIIFLFTFVFGLLMFLTPFSAEAQPVFADDATYDFPEKWFSSSSSESTYSIVFNYLDTNSNYNSIIGSKGLTCIAVSGSNVYIQLIPDPVIELSSSSNFYFYNASAFYSTIISSNSLSSASSCSFTSYSQTGSSVQGLSISSDGSLYSWCQIRPSSIGSSSNLMPYVAFSSKGFAIPFDPVLDPLLDYPYNLDVQRQAFLEWLLVDNKYELINDAILQNHVGGWVDLFADYGGSQSFFRRVALQFIAANNISMGINDINDSLTVTKRLYQVYLAEKEDTVRNHLNRRTEDTDNIIPVTNDNDTSLITDSQTDTVDISILRDILRACINIPNVISDNFSILFDTLSDLDNTVIITNQGGVSDLSILYEYDINDFNDDFTTFEENVSDITAVPLSYVQIINNNSLMPENMLSDKQSLTVAIPVINGFTVNSEGTQYETNTDTYTLNSTDYPWLDTIVKKMKRFASIMLIIGYLIHLRFKIADIVRGE